MGLHVAQQTDDDWLEVWAALEPAFRAGESYPLPRDVTEAVAKAYWIKRDGFNAVARDDGGHLVGVYYLRPDQGGPGDHVCNAGYVIADKARGKGYAVKLCVQSQNKAKEMGYRAMKFNLVVANNEAAIRAWRKAGMEIIGTIPNAFRHPTAGYVDAHIMHKDLIK